MLQARKNDGLNVVHLKDKSHRKDGIEIDGSEGCEDEMIQTNTYRMENTDSHPIDHGWAWITVLGCFGVLALIVGSLKSFGVLLVDLSRRLDAPTSIIAATQSLAGFFHLGLAPLANAISTRYSHRVVVFVGGIFAGVGFIATAYVPSVEWLYITYGIIAGIGFGLTLSPALVCMGLHFNTRRSFANGLSASGSGAGSFALPNLMRYLLHEYGFQGCLLITGAIVLNTCCFACLFRPHSYWNRKIKKTFCETENLIEYVGNQKQEFELQGIKESDLKMEDHYRQNNSTSLLDQRQTNERNFKNTLFSSAPNIDFYSDGKCINLKSESLKSLNIKDKEHKCQKVPVSSFLYTSMESMTLPNQGTRRVSFSSNADKKQSKCLVGCQNALDWSLLKEPLFMIYNTSLWTGIFGHHTIFICLPSLANEFGISDVNGAFLISLVGISDLFGRISSGWFSDFKFLERKRIYQICLGLFTVCCFIIPHVTSFVGLCVMSVFAGLTTGGYAGIQIAVLADVFGTEKLSSSWGFVAFFSSISLLISPFVSGLTRDISGTWTNVLRLSGSVMAFGFILLFFDNSVSKLCSKSKLKK